MNHDAIDFEIERLRMASFAYRQRIQELEQDRNEWKRLAELHDMRRQELQTERDAMREALGEYVESYQQWEDSVTALIGRHPDTGVHLEKARAVLERFKK